MASRKELRALITLAGKIDPSLQRTMLKASKESLKMSRNLQKSGMSIGRLGRLAKKTMLGVAKTTAIAGTALAAGIGIGGKAMINQAENMEQYRNTLNIVMKDHQKAAKTFKWAVNFANKTPFETDQIVQATVKLTNYGLEAQKVLPLVGDMAGVMGKSIDQAVEAIADAQQGELERLKEFGITKQMIIDQANKVMRGKQIVNNKGQITDQKAFNLALFSLMKERYQGGMEIQAKSWKGLISTITGVWKTGLAQMAGITDEGTIRQGSFFDIAKKRISGLSQTMLKLQETGAFEKWGQMLGGITTKVFDTIDRYLPVAIDLAKKVPPVVSDIYSGLKWVSDLVLNTWPTIEPIVYGIVSAMVAYKVAMLGVVASQKAAMIIEGLSKAWKVGSAVLMMFQSGASLATVAQWALNAAMSANPIAVVVVAIGALVAAGVALYKNWDTVSKFLSETWEKIKYVFFSGINWVIDKVNGLIEKLNKIPGVNIPVIAKVKVDDTAIKKAQEANAVSNTLGISYDSYEVYNQAYEKVPTKGLGISYDSYEVPKYALGGIANRPSIFGEAGPEMAIPLKRTPRSLGLLRQTAQILGIQSAASTSTGPTVQITYAPNIHGGNKAELEPILQQHKEDLRAMVEDIIYGDRRVQFG
jgi:hypothetical protein